MSAETRYFIEVRYGREFDWIGRDTMTGLVADMLSGEIENVTRILKADVDENTIRDITEDVARHIFDTYSDEPFANHVANFLEKQLPDQIAVQLRRAA